MSQRHLYTVHEENGIQSITTTCKKAKVDMGGTTGGCGGTMIPPHTHFWDQGGTGGYRGTVQ